MAVTKPDLAESFSAKRETAYGLELDITGAWFDRGYRMIPGRDNDGPLLVLVPSMRWDLTIIASVGDLAYATRKVAQDAARHGTWRTHEDVRALMLS